jgi:hypothetical protein
MCNCIPQAAMPQIDWIDYPALMAYLSAQGVPYTPCTVEPRKLRGRQRVHHAYVRKAMASPEEMRKPVLVSADNLIIDGNHRWMGHVIKHSDVPVLRIERPFSECLPLVFSFPKTWTYGVIHHA